MVTLAGYRSRELAIFGMRGRIRFDPSFARKTPQATVAYVFATKGIKQFLSVLVENPLEKRRLSRRADSKEKGLLCEQALGSIRIAGVGEILRLAISTGPASTSATASRASSAARSAAAPLGLREFEFSSFERLHLIFLSSS